MVVKNQFPMGAKWEFGPIALIRLLISIVTLKFRWKFIFSIDLLGDIRELTLGLLVNHKRHFSPSWQDGNEFADLVYKAPTLINRGNTINIGSPGLSVYDYYDKLNNEVASRCLLNAPQTKKEKARRSNSRQPLIGIHPMGTCPSKLWPTQHWLEVIEHCKANGYLVNIYGAPSERELLIRRYGSRVPQAQIVTESLAGFEKSVSSLDLLIGLDSFSVHMAAKTHTLCIVINSANYPMLWTPPTATIVRTEGLCSMQPCLHKAPCESQQTPYRCMQDLLPSAVIKQLDQQLLPTKHAISTRIV
jgi:hypothetical protein